MTKLKLAVIGKDVSKSVSPQIHKFIAEREGYVAEYTAVSVEEGDFAKKIPEILRTYDGINVTIPYKLAIMPYLKRTEGDAKVFGAVNTVDCKTLTGYNTDGAGFALMLENGGIDVAGKKVVVLGAGGAGRSVIKKLSDAGAETFVYDKNTANMQNVAKEFANVKTLEQNQKIPCYAIINATGVGMHKTEGISPVQSDFLELCEVAIDLIYVPAQSEFLRTAVRLGKKTLNGSAMLFYQAYFAECVFTGREANADRARQLFLEFSGEKI